MGDNPTVEEIFDGWMKSEHHRENILDKRYAEIGIGVVQTEKGETYCTQVFAQPRRR